MAINKIIVIISVITLHVVNTLAQITFEKTLGSPNQEQGYGLQQTTDGGYIIIGSMSNNGANGIYLIKTNFLGNITWAKTFSGFGYFVQQTSEGGYILTGYISSGGNYGTDILIIKIDENGNQIWQKIIGGYGTEYGYCIQQTSDSGYIITGEILDIFLGLNFIYLIKTDSNGDTLWTRKFGGGDDDKDFLFSRLMMADI